MLPNAYSHCLFTVTVSDMKSRSAHAFMCGGCGGGGGGVCVCVCVCVWCVCVCVCGMGGFYCNRMR